MAGDAGLVLAFPVRCTSSFITLHLPGSWRAKQTEISAHLVTLKLCQHLTWQINTGSFPGVQVARRKLAVSLQVDRPLYTRLCRRKFCFFTTEECCFLIFFI